MIKHGGDNQIGIDAQNNDDSPSKKTSLTLVRSLKHFKPYQIMYIYRACIENASQISLSNYTSLLLNSGLFNTVAVMPPI